MYGTDTSEMGTRGLTTAVTKEKMQKTDDVWKVKNEDPTGRKVDIYNQTWYPSNANRNQINSIQEVAKPPPKKKKTTKIVSTTDLSGGMSFSIRDSKPVELRKEVQDVENLDTFVTIKGYQEHSSESSDERKTLKPARKIQNTIKPAGPNKPASSEKKNFSDQMNSTKPSQNWHSINRRTPVDPAQTQTVWRDVSSHTKTIAKVRPGSENPTHGRTTTIDPTWGKVDPSNLYPYTKQPDLTSVTVIYPKKRFQNRMSIAQQIQDNPTSRRDSTLGRPSLIVNQRSSNFSAYKLYDQVRLDGRGDPLLMDVLRDNFYQGTHGTGNPQNKKMNLTGMGPGKLPNKSKFGGPNSAALEGPKLHRDEVESFESSQSCVAHELRREHSITENLMEPDTIVQRD
jgi:hypothetical protein